MKVLMVEDEKRLSESLAEVLKKNNYDCDLATDGEFGLDCALTGIYDAIILDIMLPKKDGISVLKEIRKNKIKTPVIMMTAKGENEDIVHGLDSGADDYLSKPFSVDVLLARLRALCRRPTEVDFNGVLTFFDIEIYMQKRILVGPTKQEVKLTSKEYNVLEFLIKQKEMVTVKDTLIERVWGLENNINDHVVETYVSFIRKKLSLIKSKTIIKSIRGVGYILEKGEGK